MFDLLPKQNVAETWNHASGNLPDLCACLNTHIDMVSGTFILDIIRGIGKNWGVVVRHFQMSDWQALSLFAGPFFRPIVTFAKVFIHCCTKAPAPLEKSKLFGLIQYYSQLVFSCYRILQAEYRFFLADDRPYNSICRRGSRSNTSWQNQLTQKFLIIIRNEDFLLLLRNAQGTSPGFWNGVDWRALVED